MKPRPSRLVALVGPSCVGKTRLTGILRRNEAPVLARLLSIDDVTDWSLKHANQLGRRERPDGDIVLHCELRPPRPAAGLVDARLDHFLRRADSVTFVTLWAPPDILRWRLTNRIVTQLGSDLRGLHVRRALGHVHKYRERRTLFIQPHALWQLYTRWFDFCDQLGDWPHWIVRSQGREVRASPLAQSRENPFGE